MITKMTITGSDNDKFGIQLERNTESVLDMSAQDAGPGDIDLTAYAVLEQQIREVLEKNSPIAYGDEIERTTRALMALLGVEMRET